MKRYKRLGNARVVKLKNRRVMASIYANGDILFKFKRLINKDEISQDVLRVSQEAVDAMFGLVCVLRLEHPEAGYLRGLRGQEKG